MFVPIQGYGYVRWSGGHRRGRPGGWEGVALFLFTMRVRQIAVAANPVGQFNAIDEV